MRERPPAGRVVTHPEWGGGIVRQTNSGPSTTVIVDFYKPPARRVRWADLITQGPQASVVFIPNRPSDVAAAPLVANRVYEILHVGHRQRYRRRSVLRYVRYEADGTVWSIPLEWRMFTIPHEDVRRIMEMPAGAPLVFGERAEYDTAKAG